MKKRLIILLAGSLAVGIAPAQTGPKTNHAHKSKKEKAAKAHYGTASYYANKFNGRKMANGDIFYQKNLTAACNIIPLNTWVKVTNLHNRKSVVVKVTDRMHRDNKRLIDLSRSAAGELQFTGNGLTRVRMEVIGRKQPPGWKAYAGR